jgi:methylated-DNA-[protein]-cysteine S-methyltransferase
MYGKGGGLPSLILKEGPVKRQYWKVRELLSFLFLVVLVYNIFRVGVGWVGVLASEAGLLRVTLPQRSASEVYQQLSDSVNRAVLSPDRFQDLMERLGAYFDGRKMDFPDRLDLSGATPFQREVWEVARRIPYGETRSYLWVAELMGKPGAVRAVGQALGRNPLPVIVPCHRVLASSGRLGGFRGGLEMKRFLLHLEAGQ